MGVEGGVLRHPLGSFNIVGQQKEGQQQHADHDLSPLYSLPMFSASETRPQHHLPIQHLCINQPSCSLLVSS